MFTLAPGAAWLLARGDTLWIFASDGVSQYDGKTAKQVPAKKLPESASPPFLLDGRPAAVQEESGERRVVALENGQWVEKAQLFFGDAKDAPAAEPPQGAGDRRSALRLLPEGRHALLS